MRVATPDRAVGHVVDAVRVALAVREAMLPTWHAEGSDTYRLLHGATEHLPGCTLDRYGSLLLWQTFREPPCDVAALLPALRELVCAELPDSPELTPAWTDRSRGARASVARRSHRRSRQAARRARARPALRGANTRGGPRSSALPRLPIGPALAPPPLRRRRCPQRICVHVRAAPPSHRHDPARAADANSVVHGIPRFRSPEDQPTIQDRLMPAAAPPRR